MMYEEDRIYLQIYWLVERSSKIQIKSNQSLPSQYNIRKVFCGSRHGRIANLIPTDATSRDNNNTGHRQLFPGSISTRWACSSRLYHSHKSTGGLRRFTFIRAGGGGDVLNHRLITFHHRHRSHHGWCSINFQDKNRHLVNIYLNI